MEARLEAANSVLRRLVLKPRIGGMRGVVGCDEITDGDEDVLLSPVALGEVKADWLATQSLVEFAVFRAWSETFCVIIAGGGPDPKTSLRLCDAGTGLFLDRCWRTMVERGGKVERGEGVERGDRGALDRLRVRGRSVLSFTMEAEGRSSGGESGRIAAAVLVGLWLTLFMLLCWSLSSEVGGHVAWAFWASAGGCEILTSALRNEGNLELLWSKRWTWRDSGGLV
jgi:hypothetical protein